MSIWTSLFLILGGIAIIVFGFHILRNHPDSFSKENLGKSLFTVGILSLFIIVVILLCVLTLKS